MLCERQLQLASIGLAHAFQAHCVLIRVAVVHHVGVHWDAMGNFVLPQ